jgi:chemosensory pili system protein ChpA (sensor histidine kinase/response regulator)
MPVTPPKKRVLVVDDSETARTQMADLLRGTYDCILAADGEEAIRRALSDSPDAVVTDLEMPRLDGIGLLRRLRADSRTQKLPVVIVTTTTSVERVNECRTLGCAGYVLKPVHKEYLYAKLKQLIAMAK